jgi:hypothetical protein
LLKVESYPVDVPSQGRQIELVVIGSILVQNSVSVGVGGGREASVIRHVVQGRREDAFEIGVVHAYHHGIGREPEVALAATELPEGSRAVKGIGEGLPKP